MPKVVIDPGHGGSDTGAPSLHQYTESQLNLDVALKVDAILSEYVDVIMTRMDDTFVSLPHRAQISNDNEAQAFVSIHFNHAGTASSANGWEIFTSPGETQADKLAECVASSHAEAFPDQTVRGDSGLKSASFSVLVNTKCPAILWEGGFLSSQKESEMISKDENRDVMAMAISKGVLNYFEIDAQTNNSTLTVEQRLDRIEKHLGI